MQGDEASGGFGGHRRLWPIFREPDRKIKEEQYMKSLIQRVENLKKLLVPNVVDWGRIYDAIREMDLTIGITDDEEFERQFIERNGTREEFIKMKTDRKENSHV